MTQYNVQSTKGKCSIMMNLSTVLDHLKSGGYEVGESFQDRNGSIIINGKYGNDPYKVFMTENGSEIVGKGSDYYDLGKDLRKFGKVWLNGKAHFA